MMRVLMVGVLLLGCKTMTGPRPVPSPLRTAPLTMLGAVPTVSVRMHGHQATCVVDTGAPQTVLLTGFAATLGVSLVKTDTVVTAANGETLPVERTPELTLEVAGGELRASWPVVASAELEAKGVGCIIAPHRLVAEGSVILDFPKRELHLFAGTMEGWLRWLDARSPKGTIDALTRVGPSDGAVFVSTRLGNGTEAVTRISTGNSGCLYSQTVVEPKQVQAGQVTAPLRAAGLTLPATVCAVREVQTGVDAQWGVEVLAEYVWLLPVSGGQLWLTKPGS